MSKKYIKLRTTKKIVARNQEGKVAQVAIKNLCKNTEVYIYIVIGLQNLHGDAN